MEKSDCNTVNCLIKLLFLCWVPLILESSTVLNKRHDCIVSFRFLLTKFRTNLLLDLVFFVVSCPFLPKNKSVEEVLRFLRALICLTCLFPFLPLDSSPLNQHVGEHVWKLFQASQANPSQRTLEIMIWFLGHHGLILVMEEIPTNGMNYLSTGAGFLPSTVVWPNPELVGGFKMFQIFFMFTPTWGNDPIRLIFFKWVETTN